MPKKTEKTLDEIAWMNPERIFQLVDSRYFEFGDSSNGYVPEAEYLILRMPRKTRKAEFIPGIVYVSVETANYIDDAYHGSSDTLRELIKKAEHPRQIRFAVANAKVKNARVKSLHIGLRNYEDTIQTYHRREHPSSLWEPISPDEVLSRFKEVEKYKSLIPVEIGTNLFFTEWQARTFHGIIMPWGKRTYHEFKRIIGEPPPYYQKINVSFTL